MSPGAVQRVGAGLFAAAVAHTFLPQYFERLAVA